MGDIDFDELDKAVNSLMGRVPKDEDDAPEQKTLSISDTLKPGEKPAYAKLEAVAKTIGNEATGVGEYKTNVEELKMNDLSRAMPVLAPAPDPVKTDVPQRESVKRPNTGRFMDVVHPSSDMKSSTSTPGLVVPEREATVFSEAAPVQQPTEGSVASTPTSETNLEVASTLEPESVPQSELSPVVSPEPEATAALDAQPAPLTPFLPDAKVEKRPLGEPIVPKQVEALPELTPLGEVEAADATAVDELTPADKDALEAAKNAFDTSEVTEVEKANDEQKPANPQDFTAVSTPEDQKLGAIESEAVAETLPLTEESVRKVESGDTGNVISRGSIPQQYEEKSKDENSTDEKGGIYDVQDYHQPLAHPAKQKSGWGTVIIILVVILICVIAAGAAYYFLAMRG
jgi:hypothetical protein